jgi:hypothetical protein
MGRMSVRLTLMAALTFLAHSSHSSSRPSSRAVDSNTRLQETRMSSFLCTGDGTLELEFYCFADFFVRMIETREELGFL